MTTSNSQDQMCSETNPKYISFMMFLKNREYCNKIFLKENHKIEKFGTNKKVLLMSVHRVRNIDLIFPQMNQSKEIHFKVLHPHNKLVQTITMGTQVVKQGYQPKSKMTTNNYIRTVIFMWSMRRLNMHQARLNFFSYFLLGRGLAISHQILKVPKAFARHSQ